jgi:hypothetical protein
MKKFNIYIEETVGYTVEVEAKNLQEAKDKVYKGEVDFGDDNINGSEISCVDGEEIID